MWVNSEEKEGKEEQKKVCDY